MRKFEPGDIIETKSSFGEKLEFYYMVLKMINSRETLNVYSVYCFQNGNISSILHIKKYKNDFKKVQINKLSKLRIFKGLQIKT